MIRILLLKYYKHISYKRLFVRGKGKFFYDYYLDCCIYLLSQKFANIFAYKKRARLYAERAISYEIN